MQKNIAALIAVRAGSKRVPEKNIRKFGDSNLLEIKINQALALNNISGVYVSSDDEYMLSTASTLGATPLARPPYYASDTVPMKEVYRYLASEIECEHILYLHVTSPLLENETLLECVEKYKNLDSNYDSLATVHSVKEYLWQDSKPINYDPFNHPRSQDLPEICALNFAANILPREFMIERGNIVGNNFCPYFLDEVQSVDIDTEFDFVIAEFLYQKLKLEKMKDNV